MAQVVVVGDEDAAPVQKEPVVETPRALEVAGVQALPETLGGHCGRCGAAYVVDEGE
jgi:hypothetical protein